MMSAKRSHVRVMYRISRKPPHIAFNLCHQTTLDARNIYTLHILILKINVFPFITKVHHIQVNNVQKNENMHGQWTWKKASRVNERMI